MWCVVSHHGGVHVGPLSDVHEAPRHGYVAIGSMEGGSDYTGEPRGTGAIHYITVRPFPGIDLHGVG